MFSRFAASAVLFALLAVAQAHEGIDNSGQIGGQRDGISVSTGIGSGTDYYVNSSTGLDSNNGLTPAAAWRTIAHVNAQTFSTASTILFNGSQTFTGTLAFTPTNSPGGIPSVASYGTGKGIILSTASQFCILANGAGVTDNNITCEFGGPGDVVSSARGWYSFTRGYNFADTSPAFNACLPPTGLTCADVPLTNGVVTTLPLALITCNNTTVLCPIAEVYDKSGNGLNLSQATNANRPILVVPGTAAAPNNCPSNANFCANFPGPNNAGQSLCTASFGATLNQPFTIAANWQAGTGNGTQGGVILGGNGVPTEFTADALSRISAYAGSNFGYGWPQPPWFIGISVFNGPSSIINVNASAVSGTTVGLGRFFQSGDTICTGNDTFGDFLVGYETEVGPWPTAFSTTQNTAMNANMNAFYNQNSAFGEGISVPFTNQIAMSYYDSSAKVDWVYQLGYVCSANCSSSSSSFTSTLAALPQAMTYNETTDVYGSLVTIGTHNSIGTDYHGRPAACEDNEGYHYAFYGAHNTATFYTRTTTINTPSSFTDTTSPITNTNITGIVCIHYPTNDKMYVFYSTQGIGAISGTAEDSLTLQICTPSSGVLTCGSQANLIDSASGGGTGFTSMGSVVLVGSQIHIAFQANTTTPANPNTMAGYAIYDIPTGNIENISSSTVVAPGAQPAGPYATLVSNFGILTATDLGWQNLIVSGGCSTIGETDNTNNPGVLEWYQYCGSSWSSPTTIFTFAAGVDANDGSICMRQNSHAKLELWYSDPQNIWQTTFGGGTFQNAIEILAQQGAYWMNGCNSPLNATKNIAMWIDEVTGSSTGEGALRTYAWGEAGFVANPNGL